MNIQKMDGKIVREITPDELKRIIQMKEDRLTQISKRQMKLSDEKETLESDLIELKKIDTE